MERYTITGCERLEANPDIITGIVLEDNIRGGSFMVSVLEAKKIIQEKKAIVPDELKNRI